MRSAVIAAILAISPVIAAAQTPSICLPLHRVYSTKVVNDVTLLATDYQHQQYTIHMAQTCVSLNQFSQNLSFRRANGIGSEYLCIRHGDILGYSFPGDPSMGLSSITVHGPQTQMQCTIDFVSPGAP